MISSLRGEITKIGNNFLEIEVGGVGYLVWMGNNFLKKHQTGENLKIQIYTAVSENDISLFGFENWDEVNLFKMLISVSGVGPKTAAQMMAVSNAADIEKAIRNADTDFFKKLKGVGLKTAQRIIIDLKSKIGSLKELDLKKDNEIEIEDDLYLSLKQLGFDKKEIEKVTKKLPKDLEKIEGKLEWCLKNI